MKGNWCGHNVKFLWAWTWAWKIMWYTFKGFPVEKQANVAKESLAYRKISEAVAKAMLNPSLAKVLKTQNKASVSFLLGRDKEAGEWLRQSVALGIMCLQTYFQIQDQMSQQELLEQPRKGCFL